MSSEQTSVYKLYDAEGRILYVGISRGTLQRLRSHAQGKDWWPEVASARFEHYATRAAACRREAELINQHQPPCNKEIPSPPPPERMCRGCGESIQDAHPTARYCSNACKQAVYRLRKARSGGVGVR